MNTYIIGNGSSRVGFDLNSLVGKGKTFGCNALHRDFHPDYLVAMDPPMIKELKENVDLKKVIHFGRTRPEQGRGGRQRAAIKDGEVITTLEHLPCQNSGMLAVISACTLFNPENVYMLGFDLHDKEANVYKGTYGYEGEYPTEARINDWKQIFSHFNKTIFHFIIPEGLGDNNIYLENNFKVLPYDFLER